MLVARINAVTDIGKIREKNEDNFCIKRYFKKKTKQSDMYSFTGRDDIIAAVFDGIGGEEQGEAAAFIAAKTTARFDGHLPGDDFNVILDDINFRINSFAEKYKCRTGCTAAMVHYKMGVIDICNLGDSSIFMYSDNQLKKISKDHTELQRALDMNLENFNAEKSAIHKRRLTKYLGINTCNVTPFVVRDMDIEPGNIVILCTDGLTDMLSDDEFYKVIKESKADNLANNLLNKALENGGKDNVSVITIHFFEKNSIYEKIIEKFF